jgi:hypothetical protein
MRSLKDDEIRWIGGGYPPQGSDPSQWDGWDTDPWNPPPPPPVYSDGPDVGGGNDPIPSYDPYWLVTDHTGGNHTRGAQEANDLSAAWDAYQVAGAGTAEERLYNWEANHPGFENQDSRYWARLADFHDGSPINGDTGADTPGGNQHYSLSQGL